MSGTPEDHEVAAQVPSEPDSVPRVAHACLRYGGEFSMVPLSLSAISVMAAKRVDAMTISVRTAAK